MLLVGRYTDIWAAYFESPPIFVSWTGRYGRINIIAKTQHYPDEGKSLFLLLQLSLKSAFPPSTSKPDKPPPSTFQTVHFTFLERF
jgi:hypothetical protein